MTTHDLRMIKIFSKLQEENLEKLFSIARIRHYAKGEILYYEDDELEVIYFLLQGSVKLYKVDRFDNEIFLQLVHQGDPITELSLLAASRCFANAECMEDCAVLSLPIDSLEEALATAPMILQELFKESLQQAHALQNIINREIVFDGTAKVACMLDKELQIFNSLKKQEVAYRLNIQPETLSRILKKLHRDGAIETDSSGDIQVLNPSRLAEIYQ